MIRLTLKAQSEPEIHLFNKSSVLIGSDSSQVDLTLPGDFQSIHLKIAQQNNCPFLINVANDPFVAINGHSFGKKLLNSGDIILIHDLEILFENLNEPNEITLEAIDESLTQSHEESQTKEIPPKINAVANQLLVELPFEKEVEALKEEEWHPSHIEQYLQQDATYKKILDSIPTNSLSAQERKKLGSLKDDHLRDLEDDNQNRMQPDEPSHLYQAWKWILLFIFSIILIAGIIGTVTYFSISDKTEAQETKAAQAVADIAAALTHAQIYHSKPYNQNWSDVDFLKSNLQSILPNTFSYATELDSHGQFNYFPYSLRIYTSTDLSCFLLIAQPAPSILQWLIPKSVILVDSYNMELHAIKDVRNLNRLLANPNPLDGINGKEISSLVKQGSLIRLSSLASDSQQINFAPPKILSSLQPGAENLIYNAPRYYRLGQGLVQRAVALATSKGTSQEVTNFKHDVSSFSRLNHLVLYAEGGRQAALQAKQGMITFAPANKIQFGYLTLTHENKIEQVALLKEEPNFLDLDAETEAVAFNPELVQQDLLGNIVVEEENIDLNHPIYVQLKSMGNLRENELRPLAAHLKSMLDSEIDCPMLNFQVQFQEISHQYLMADAKHKNALREALYTLYDQYEEMPVDQFLLYAKKAGCERLIQQNEQQLSFGDENRIQNLATLLAQIGQAKSLVELDNLIHIACSWMTFDYIGDPKELVEYQNLLRNQVLQQLERLLLSDKRNLAFKELIAEDRETLRHILSYEKIIKPEEQEFFLEEFDRLHSQENSSLKQGESGQ
jgi:hypothetical protein